MGGKKKKKIWKILLVLVVIVAALLGGAYGVFKTQFYDLTTYVAKGSMKLRGTQTEATYGDSGFTSDEMMAAAKVAGNTRYQSSDEEGETETGTESEETEHRLSSEAESELLASHEMEMMELADKMFDTKSTYNLLLLGVDRRDDSWYGNSDVIVLVTVNMENKQIYLTSFLRDLYANIPGIGVRKLNAACANGGPELAVETLEETYQVEIDNYAMVDFNAMISVIDEVGGVDIEIDEDERVTANDYITTMCEANGDDPEDYYIEEAGMVHLNGYQAVGYARNRYTGKGSDFGRTQRQRNILTAFLDKVQDGEYDSLTEVVRSVLPYITHDITEMEMLGLLMKLNGWIDYDIEQQHIPYDNEYYSENEILIPKDMSDTILKINRALYGDGVLETESESETESDSEAVS